MAARMLWPGGKMGAFLDLLDGVLDATIMLLVLAILIAHSCGELDPQALSRQHAFVINDQGQPSPLATHLSP